MPGVAEAVRPVVERIDRRAPGARDFGLRFWDGSEVPPPPTADDELTLVVRDPVALAYALRQPNELGFGRAWVTGALDVDGDLERGLALRDRFGGLRLSAADRLAALRAVARLGGVRLRGPAVPASEAPVGRGRRHSLDRDRVAVRHHYDVSNAFYRMVLGPTMVYSCAYFSSPDDTLEVAQTRKLETICRKLRLRARDRLLDIGCGWGTLVLHAAREHGARAVGVTLSQPQAELARERIRAAGLSDRCEIRVADYREVDDGPYDKVSSVGMYEHVGRAQLGEYAGRVTRLLREGGLFLNHGIVRARRGCGTSTASSPATSSPTASCTRWAPSSTRWSRPAWRSATTKRCASTTRSRCAAGWPTWPPTATRRSPRPAPSASACGAST